MTTLLDRHEVERQTSLARATIYKMMLEGRFPRPLQLGDKCAPRH